MKIFVTGSTGYVGNKLVHRLAQEGEIVHALCRSKSKHHLLQHQNIVIIEGDIFDEEAVLKGMAGCYQVYHLAAYVGVWNKNRNEFYRVNVEGTKNILDKAIHSGVKRSVVTSTAGVFGPAITATVTEETTITIEPFTDYEKSKREVEKIALSYCDKGIEVVIVNPSRIYGPGIRGESNSVTKMIDLYINGKWRLIPENGEGVGNYVFIDDVVNGHLLAMEKGRDGEKYILGGDNINYNELFRKIREVARVDYMLIKLPLWLMMVVAGQQKLFAELFGIKPFITPPWVRRYVHKWTLSCEKAEVELGYKSVSIKEGVIKTVDWLRETS
ncbi:MAG: SDR family oxidoreductase [Flavobacteriales bacterium]|nr:SDR family oxidoreductase [Flavobacteriales bacterium]